jgi:hypothetical protein
MTTIRAGKYRHYKNKDYLVIGIGRHTETLEEVVLYQSLYGTGEFWVRPAAMFNEDIEYEGKIQKRFQFIGE